MFRSLFVFRSEVPKPGARAGRAALWKGSLTSIRGDSTCKAKRWPVKFQRAVKIEDGCWEHTRLGPELWGVKLVLRAHAREPEARKRVRRGKKKARYQRLPRSPRSPRSPPRPPPPRPPRSPPRPPPYPPPPPRPPPPPERSVCGRASLTTRFRPPKF
jgi:hypothetical protein